MSTQSKKLNLRKPDGVDAVSVQLDISDNFQKLDDAGGGKVRVQRTSGNILFSASAWTHFPTAADFSLDLPLLKANVGDWVEVGMKGFSGPEATDMYLDAYSCPVQGTAVRAWSGSGLLVASNAGMISWFGKSGETTKLTGGDMQQVQAGDLTAGGELRLGLWARDTAAGSRTFYATADIVFSWWAINHGQP